MKPIFVIEHLETEIGKWLLYEYANASEIIGKHRLTFTNIKRKNEALKLSKLGRVENKTAAEIFNQKKVIVLDPKAQQPLKTEDFQDAEAVIVGGILGEIPPKGRTFQLLTKSFPTATVRNLGKINSE